MCSCISPMASRILFFKAQLSLACRHNTYLSLHPTNNSPTVSNHSSDVAKRHHNGLSLLIFEENGPIMPLHQNRHQTVTRFGCVGFSMYVCGFSVPQMRQFYLFTYLPRSKWASSEKMIFFCDKSASSVIRSQVHFPKLFKRSFAGSMKLIICQIRHNLSVTIHEISTSWKKKLDSEPYSLFLK